MDDVGDGDEQAAPRTAQLRASAQSGTRDTKRLLEPYTSAREGP
jgi:hypothetical protein